MRKYLLFLLISSAFLVCLFIYQSVEFSDKKLRVVFCDVGQGDAIYIRTPGGEDILIDGGPNDKVLDCLASHMPIWDRKIEVVYLTHPDADHLTGLINVVKSYEVDYFGTSQAPKSTEVFEELNRVLDQYEIEKNFVVRGDYLRTAEGLAIKTLWPTKEFLNSPSNDTNDYSLVQKLEYEGFTALFTGDIPAVYLNSIMPLVGDVDVFKPPHHGSKTGMDEFTLKYSSLGLAVISSGKDNRYGHPSKEIIDILSNNKIQYLNTAENGDVEVIFDGEKIEMVVNR